MRCRRGGRLTVDLEWDREVSGQRALVKKCERDDA
jgi:hypothetical protein